METEARISKLEPSLDKKYVAADESEASSNAIPTKKAKKPKKKKKKKKETTNDKPKQRFFSLNFLTRRRYLEKESQDRNRDQADNKVKQSDNSANAPESGAKEHGKTQRSDANADQDLEKQAHADLCHLPEPDPRPSDNVEYHAPTLPYTLSVTESALSVPEESIDNMVSGVQSSGTCVVCRKNTPKNCVNALGNIYHQKCFRCSTCHDPIDLSNTFAFAEYNGVKHPMHPKCYVGLYATKCTVCEEAIPCGTDGKISFFKHRFFKSQNMCTQHANRIIRRCTGCHRFEPKGSPFANLHDAGRIVCFSCCQSVIVDSEEAQTLWTKVIEFLENKLNLPIWKNLKQIPVLIVGYNALENQMANAGSFHAGSSQIMARGLCLTETAGGMRFKMNRMKFNEESKGFIASDAEDRGFTYFQVPDSQKVNPDTTVTAVMCLSGLPRDLAAGVLAHEAVHAWIKLHPQFKIGRPIPPQVEEGCAQLVSFLFLNDALEPPQDPATEPSRSLPMEPTERSGPSDSSLRDYFKYSIENDDHHTYGLGFKKAKQAYTTIGIQALLSHVILYQEFPET